jgi:hypothetical protein
MKTLLFVVAFMSLLVGEANAVVYCAVGPYRAGCVARPGYHPYVRPYARPYGYHPYGYHPYYHRY